MRIAQYLHREGIRGTFFFNGCRFKGAPAPSPLAHQTCLPPDQERPVERSYIGEMVALHQRVGNHLQDHAYMPFLFEQLGAPATREQALRTHEIIEPYIRDELFVLRPPHNAWSGGVAKAINGVLPTYQGPFLYNVVPSQQDYACLDCTAVALAAHGRPSHCVGISPETPQSCADKYVAAIGTGIGQVDRGIVQLHDREFALELAGAAAQTQETFDLAVHLVSELRARGYVFVPLDAVPGILGPKRVGRQALWTDHYSDARGWASHSSYYLAIRFADLDGDGDADVCGRGAGGLWCMQSTGDGFANPQFWLMGPFGDARGWKRNEYGATFQLGDLDGDGDADACARGGAGLYCAVSRGGQGSANFGPAELWSHSGDFSDAENWDGAESYFLSLRLADVDGDGRADACGRGAAGVHCAPSTGAGFAKKTLWLSRNFADANGYLPAPYGTAVDFGDLDGDGRADVCARGPVGIHCALAKSSADGFHDAELWLRGAFSDADEWHVSPSKYGSIALADVTGDGRADVCGRNDTGIVCAFSDGTRFIDYLHLRNDDYHDRDGWAPSEYGATVAFADVDGDGLSDVCGRGVSGIWCSRAADALRTP